MMHASVSTLARRAGGRASCSLQLQRSALLRPRHADRAPPAALYTSWANTACARRSLHTTARRLADGPRASRPKTALADALLSQWSRPSAHANAGGGTVKHAEHSEAAGPSGTAADSGSALNGAGTSAAAAVAAPPSIEELFAETEDTTDTTVEARGTREGELRENSATPSGASSSRPSASRSESVNTPQRASTPSAHEAPEAAVLTDLLQQQLTAELLEVDDGVDADVDADDNGENDDEGGGEETDEDAAWGEADVLARTGGEGATRRDAAETASASPPRADAADGASPVATESPRPPSNSASHVLAAAADQPDATPAGSVEEDEDESMEDVLEEEAERLYRAAIADMTREAQRADSSHTAPRSSADGAAGAAGSGEPAVRRGAVSEYTFFPKEAVQAAVETLAALEHAKQARGAALASSADEPRRASPAPVAEFDDAAAREAELASLGDDMASAERAGAAASRR